jgi:hypothetical protein
VQDTFYFTSLPAKRSLKIPAFLAGVAQDLLKRKHKFLMLVTLQGKLL